MPKAHRSHRPAGAQPWIIALLALAAVLTAFLLLRRDRPSAADAAAGAGAIYFDETAAVQELDQLQQRFTDLVSSGKDVTPLIVDMQRLVERYPRISAARTLWAQALLFTGRGREALQQLEQSLQLDPRQAEVHLLAGTVALQLAQIEVAERHYSQAVGLDTANGRYRLHLASIYLKQQDYDKARATLLEALRCDSSLHEAHAALSDLYAQQNKVNLAVEQIKRALELSPPDDHARRTIYLRKEAALFRRDNKPEEALAVLRQLPPVAMMEIAVGDDLAGCWAMLGQPDKAASHFEQVLIIDATNDLAAARAALWRIRADQPDKARQNLETLRRINPRSNAIAEIENMLAASAAAAPTP
jgi:Tfp pilus assembly protein PilF